MAAVRGDAYTAFLARAKRLINGRGKAMRINFQVDWYRPDPPRQRRLAYPANVDFQWQRWIEEGLPTRPCCVSSPCLSTAYSTIQWPRT